jgi:hypothetical protein
VALIEAHTTLKRVADAALISRFLGIPVRPWELDAWPLDERLAARALAERWMKYS